MTEKEGPERAQRHCRNCEAEVGPEDAFCRSCGASLTSEAEAPGQERPPTAEPPSASSDNPFSRDALREFFSELLRRFKGLPMALKVAIVAVVALLLLTVLSPLGLLAAAVLFGISLIGLVIRLAQRRSVKGWGIVAVASFVLIFVFSGMSDALYGGAFTADTVPKPKADAIHAGGTQTYDASGSSARRYDCRPMSDSWGQSPEGAKPSYRIVNSR